MSDPGPLSFHLMVALGAALLGASVAVWLRQSIVLGYILAGIVIGPFTPGPMGRVDVIEQLAEIGVVLLLFVLGAQLSLRELFRAGRLALLGALLQVLVMLAIGYAFARALGFGAAEAFALGAVVSNSSSTVLAKLLGETGEVGSLHARIGLAWSSVQDVSTVILLAVLGVFASTGETELPGTLLRALAWCLLVLPAGLWALPRVFRTAALGNREIFTLLVVFVALAMGWVSALLGVSVALGAFVAGLLVGESDVAHRVLGDAIPLRDVFSGLFFVSVGMLVDAGFVAGHLPLVLLALGLIVVVKGAVTFATARALGSGARVSLLVASGLAQSGEFSFLMARAGHGAGVVGDAMFNTMLSATAGSILLAPLVGRAAHRAVRSRGIASRLAVEGPEAPLPTGHVVVCGYGRVGALVCSLLERMRLPFVVVDDDLHVVDRLRATHVPVVFGDVGFAHVLDAAGLGGARVLVLCVPEPYATRRAVDHARKTNPELAILARSHSTKERDILYAR